MRYEGRVGEGITMIKRLAIVACAVICLGGGAVQAGDVNDQPTGLNQAPVSDSELAGQRARGSGDVIDASEYDTQINNLTEKGRVDHNSVSGSNTGNNIVTNSAFAGASGFATVIQNSGNNVLIQNSTIVNYSSHP
jgi:hypothetical protein